VAYKEKLVTCFLVFTSVETKNRRFPLFQSLRELAVFMEELANNVSYTIVLLFVLLRIADTGGHYNFQNTTRSFLFFFSRDTQEGLIRALNWYPPGITRICFFFPLLKKNEWLYYAVQTASGQGHYPTGKGLEKKPQKGLKKKP
jgi:hypothetical protein